MIIINLNKNLIKILKNWKIEYKKLKSPPPKKKKQKNMETKIKLKLFPWPRGTVATIKCGSFACSDEGFI